MAVNHNYEALITVAAQTKRGEKHKIALAGQGFSNDTYKPLISKSDLATKRR